MHIRISNKNLEISNVMKKTLPILQFLSPKKFQTMFKFSICQMIAFVLYVCDISFAILQVICSFIIITLNIYLRLSANKKIISFVYKINLHQISDINVLRFFFGQDRRKKGLTNLLRINFPLREMRANVHACVSA